MNLKNVLQESFKKEYSYRVKLAADCTDEHMNMLEKILQKYDLVSIAEFKRTPIQENPTEFVRHKGTRFTSEVCSTDVVIRYPINSRILEVYIAANLGIDHDRVLAYDVKDPRRIESDMAAARVENDLDRDPRAEDSALAQEDMSHQPYDAAVEVSEDIEDLTLFGEEYNAKFLDMLKKIRAEKGADYFRNYPSKDELMGDNLRPMFDQVMSNGRGMAPEEKAVSINNQNLGH